MPYQRLGWSHHIFYISVCWFRCNAQADSVTLLCSSNYSRQHRSVWVWARKHKACRCSGFCWFCSAPCSCSLARAQRKFIVYGLACDAFLPAGPMLDIRVCPPSQQGLFLLLSMMGYLSDGIGLSWSLNSCHKSMLVGMTTSAPASMSLSRNWALVPLRLSEHIPGRIPRSPSRLLLSVQGSGRVSLYFNCVLSLTHLGVLRPEREEDRLMGWLGWSVRRDRCLSPEIRGMVTVLRGAEIRHEVSTWQRWYNASLTCKLIPLSINQTVHSFDRKKVMNLILVFLVCQCNIYVIPKSIRRKDLGYKSLLKTRYQCFCSVLYCAVFLLCHKDNQNMHNARHVKIRWEQEVEFDFFLIQEEEMKTRFQCNQISNVPGRVG